MALRDVESTEERTEQYWRAIAAKDRSYDGTFVFGVVTTGVFCRPSCAARTPSRRNVRFFDAVADAARQGFRPCRRCRPLEPSSSRTDAVRMASLCHYIQEHSGTPLTLDVLASRAGVSRFHLQRSFKAVVGVTPTQYLEACRLARFRGSLRKGATVTEAIYGAGFGSSSRLYERIDTRLGMTPSEYREGGKGVAITCASAQTPLGTLMVGATDRGVCFVQFGGSHTALLGALRKEYPAAAVEELRKPYPPQFHTWMRAVLDHLRKASEGPPDVPLDIRATAFQLKVWRCLQTIPRGAVRSYEDVARQIGRPGAARAVAGACAANRVALVVPCHRVIRGDGSLGGFRWGLDRKRTLLEAERAAGGPPGTARRSHRGSGRP